MQRSTPSWARDNPRLLEILKLISRRACKFKGSSSESLTAHLLAQFNIKRFYTAHCYLAFQRELMWQDSSLINAQTPACCAAWTQPLFRLWTGELWVSIFVFHQPFLNSLVRAQLFSENLRIRQHTSKGHIWYILSLLLFFFLIFIDNF